MSNMKEVLNASKDFILSKPSKNKNAVLVDIIYIVSLVGVYVYNIALTVKMGHGAV